MKEQDNDKLLIFGLQNNDPQAYKELYSRYAPRLQAFASKFRMTPEEADEIVQETFIRIWLHRHKIDADSAFSAYIITIARNLIYNQIRKTAFREDYKKDLLREQSGQLEMPADSELKNLINKAILSLPEKCRLIFRKSRFEGYTNAQIAEELKISKSTVENQLNKALKTIRKELEEKGYGTSLAFFLFFFTSP